MVGLCSELVFYIVIFVCFTFGIVFVLERVSFRDRLRVRVRPRVCHVVFVFGFVHVFDWNQSRP